VRISAALIVKDEEQSLESCLGSLRGVVDEIVVVDTGSHDRTVEVARRFTDRIFTFPWIDDFAAARNFSIECASGDYILVIDADNCVANPEEARGLLDQFVRRHPESVVGTVEIVNRMGAGHALVVEAGQRFFKRGRYRYTGAIHEQLGNTGTDPTFPEHLPGIEFSPLGNVGSVPVFPKGVAATGVRFSHSGYARELDSPLHKSHRNKRMLQAELAKHPDDEYYWYQLGKAHFGLHEYGDACAAFERAASYIAWDAGPEPCGRLGPVAAEVLTDLVASLVYAYVNTGRVKEAIECIERHRTLGHTGTRSPDYHHALGYVYLMAGDIARARAGYLESLRFGAAAEQVQGTASFSSLYHLGLLCEAERDVPGALVYYQRAIESKPDYAPAIARSIDLIIEQQIAPPVAIWNACDQGVFEEAYVARLRLSLEERDSQGATLLLQTARALSPTLYNRCAAITPR
jgi:tetratricopeptide (TPR) repeat protein